MDHHHGTRRIAVHMLGVVASNLLLTIGTVAHAADSPRVSRFNDGFDDFANTIATDSLGNTYVGGRVESADRKFEFAVIKYDANGAHQWTARYRNSEHATDYGVVSSIAVDAAGNVYAAGSVYRSIALFNQNMDWVVVSYSPDGAERWSHRIDGTAQTGDSAGEAAVDGGGNIYVSGSIQDVEHAGQAGWTLIKYSPHGAVLWRRTDVRSDGIRDTLTKLRFDAQGSLVGSGSVFTQTFPQHKIVTTKLDAAGNVVWRRLFSDTALSDDVFADMDIDAAGNIYVTGETVATTNFELPHVPITLKYDAGGNLKFVLRGDGAGGSSVVVDPFGNVVVSGTAIRDGGSGLVPATAKYDAAGNRIWLTPGIDGELSADNAGNIYSFSTAQLFTANRSDLQTVKLDANGAIVWQHRYDGRLTNNGSADWAIASVLDRFDNLLAVGNAQDGILDDIVTLRYAANVTPQQPPATLNAPTNLTATAQSARVLLSWSDNSLNEAAFSVERCVGRNCASFVPIAQVSANTSSYADSNVSRRTTYRYRVRAVAQSVASVYSNVVTVTTPRR